MSITEVTVTRIPRCDLCLPGRVPAYADAKLDLGPWAYVCREHFDRHGCTLGTGRGQILVVKGGADSCTPL